MEAEPEWGGHPGSCGVATFPAGTGLRPDRARRPGFPGRWPAAPAGAPSAADLFNRVIARETLAVSAAEVLAHAAGSGEEDPTLLPLRACPAEFVLGLQSALAGGRYRPEPVACWRSAQGCVHRLTARDRVVAGALLLTVGPVLAAAAPGESGRELRAIRAALRRGCFRLRSEPGADGICRDELWGLFRVVAEQVVDPRVRELLKLLLRAPVVERLRAAGYPAFLT